MDEDVYAICILAIESVIVTEDGSILKQSVCLGRRKGMRVLMRRPLDVGTERMEVIRLYIHLAAADRNYVVGSIITVEESMIPSTPQSNWIHQHARTSFFDSVIRIRYRAPQNLSSGCALSLAVIVSLSQRRGKPPGQVRRSLDSLGAQIVCCSRLDTKVCVQRRRCE